MEGLGGFGFSNVGSGGTKKRRSATSRRGRPDMQFVFGGARDNPSPPSSPDDEDKLSHRRKEFYLNGPAPPRVSTGGKKEGGVGVPASKNVKKDVDVGGGSGRSSEQGRRGDDSKHRRDCAVMTTSWKNTSRTKESFGMQSRSPMDGSAGRNRDGNSVHQSGRDSNMSAEHKLTKVKLKVGGVTRTIHAKSNEETGNGDNGGSSSSKPVRSSDASRHRQKHVNQDNSRSPPEEGNGWRGDRRKDFTRVGFSRGAREDSRGKVAEESLSGKQTDKAHTSLLSEPVRKSNRVPKRRVLDGEFDQGDADDEIRCLEKRRASKESSNTIEHENDGEDVKKRKLSKVSKSTAYEVDEDYGSLQQSKDNLKMSKPGREHNETDYVEEEETGSDAGSESKRKKQKKVSMDSPVDVRNEPITTRQRALQSGKGGVGASLIEFPDGLPPPPPRRQKEKLSEVEQQAKKAEAAQRRKLQVEKQEKEIQDGVIRKILGLDSDKKKEEKKQKDLEEKAKASQELASNTIRWIMGPTGTVVVFPEDVGLPSIFDSKQCSYPPPREKCAGPSCTNAYKYRDSRSNLPLCSLQCYRAVQGHAHSLTTC